MKDVGEAKNRRKLRDRIIADMPFCIYCGGVVPASTMDHSPASAFFDLRQRPLGLEFPSCEPCNRGGRLDELAAAALSRVYPDSETIAGREELKKLFKSLKNNHPGLLEELMPSFRQQKVIRQSGVIPPDGAGALNCQGPLLNAAILRVAAKMGYALHFELTKKPVPLGGAAGVTWFTNYQALSGDIPEDLVDLMGNPRTLMQGRREVGEQFRYASVGTEDGSMTAHLVTFRFSFATCAFVANNAESVRVAENSRYGKIFRPGWLKATIDG